MRQRTFLTEVQDVLAEEVAKIRSRQDQRQVQQGLAEAPPGRELGRCRHDAELRGPRLCSQARGP